MSWLQLKDRLEHVSQCDLMVAIHVRQLRTRVPQQRCIVRRDGPREAGKETRLFRGNWHYNPAGS